MIKQCEIDWYHEIMPELHVVFDVGCKNDNVFYQLNPKLEIHLFDPQRPSKKMNGTFNNIALSDKRGTQKYHPEYGSIHRRELKGDKWKHIQHYIIEIQTDTLDNYCEQHGITEIDLLKIDAEGHDYYVLLGAERMLPNIRYIQFEQWNNEMTRKIKELLLDYDVEELGGKPMNYKCKRR